MSNLTGSLVVVSKHIYDYLTTGKETLGINEVWYDITGLVPTTPALLVEPQGKTRVISNTGHMVENNFNVSIVLLHSRMASKSVTNEESLELAEAVEDYLHLNKELNGLVIHSHVTSVEQGSVTQERVLLRATRLMWQGMSKTRI